MPRPSAIAARGSGRHGLRAASPSPLVPWHLGRPCQRHGPPAHRFRDHASPRKVAWPRPWRLSRPAASHASRLTRWDLPEPHRRPPSSRARRAGAQPPSCLSRQRVWQPRPVEIPRMAKRNHGLHQGSGWRRRRCGPPPLSSALGSACRLAEGTRTFVSLPQRSAHVCRCATGFRRSRRRKSPHTSSRAAALHFLELKLGHLTLQYIPLPSKREPGLHQGSGWPRRCCHPTRPSSAPGSAYCRANSRGSLHQGPGRSHRSAFGAAAPSSALGSASPSAETTGLHQGSGWLCRASQTAQPSSAPGSAAARPLLSGSRSTRPGSRSSTARPFAWTALPPQATSSWFHKPCTQKALPGPPGVFRASPASVMKGASNPVLAVRGSSRSMLKRRW